MNETDKSGGFLNDTQYNAVKFLTVVLLPASGALYFSLSSIWGLPAAEQVLGTILAIETFIGVVLGISTKQYENSGAKYDGDINITEDTDTGKKTASLELKHPDPVVALDSMDEVTFKVNKT